jgi:predicted DNA-binding transcriptional regulator AlpA
MTLSSAAAPSAFAPTPLFETEKPPSSRERFISFDEVHNRTGLSRTTIWRLEKIKDFPKSVRISPGRRAWRESDLDRWIASRLEPAE